MQEQEKPFKIKKPWPTVAAMTQIYEKNLWGGNGAFYSGDGSHQSEIILPYLKAVKAFLTSFKKTLVVCDLGCGDFNVGKELVEDAKKYIAVDIVKDLIAFNKTKFKEEHLVFECLDIAKDNLPVADCVIVRQVLQHLSNEEIQHILAKLTRFKYIILTEHLPEGNFIPNKDIISGQGIRLKKQSGVNILKAPFYFKVKEKKELLKTPLKDHKGIIKTTLYTTF